MVVIIIISSSRSADGCPERVAANLRTKILDSGGFDASKISILRGGSLMSIGNSLESLSHAILVGTILVGRLGVLVGAPRDRGDMNEAESE